MITDCSALTTANQKKDLVPRIARWWLTIQDFNFVVVHHSGTQMRHRDSLSRNTQQILHIELADWILSAQMIDTKLQQIKDILSKPPITDYEKKIYKDYALRNQRIYCITVKGIQWVVPLGLRRQVI